MWLGLIVFFWTCSAAYEILYGINCGGSNDIASPSVTYLADKYFTQDTFTLHKNYISRSVKDQVERSLIKNERTSKKDFSYLLPIKEEGRFGIILRFYEYEFVDPDSRVFAIKLGEQHLFTIDIIEEVGAKKPLTKFIQFQIKNGILYIQTSPALNAFNFMDKTVRLKFQKIKGNPKVQILLIIKGSLETYKKQYFEAQKLKMQGEPVEYLCERLYDATHNNVYLDDVSAQEASPYYYVLKIFCTKSGVASLILFLVISFKDTIILQFEMRVRNLERKYKMFYMRADKEKTK